MPPHLLCSRQPPSTAFLTPPTAGGDSSAAAIDRMLDMISRSPQMQQMMMATLPPAMRRPEMIQQMLANPQARKQIADMLSRQVRRASATELLHAVVDWYDKLNSYTPWMSTGPAC